MKQTNDKSTMETQTTIKKILDFIVGFLGSLILADIGIVLMGQFNDLNPFGSHISFGSGVYSL